MEKTHMAGSELKALREAAGLSQEDLARSLEVSVGTVSRWERGFSGISKPTASHIRATLVPKAATA